MFTPLSYEVFYKDASPFFPILSEKAYEEITQLNAPNEECGVIRKTEFIKLTNYSHSKTRGLVDTEDLKPGDILLHTHVGQHSNPVFSTRDILTGKRANIPMLLWHTHFKNFDFWSPIIPHPYPMRLRSKFLIQADFVGLEYQYIRSDCYSFTRDVSKALFKKELPDIYNKIQSTASMKYFFKNPENLGFKRIGTFKKGAYVLMTLSPQIPYHMGIIINAEPPKRVTILHQIGERTLSEYLLLDDLMPNVLGVYDISKDFYFK